MSRIRTVKPEFWTDAKLSRCTRDARLTFIGLLNESDDQGRQIYSAMRISGTLYPQDNIAPRRIDAWVGELEGVGVLHQYESEGIQYLCIPNLRKHQVVNKPSASRLPPCPTHGTLQDSSGSPPVPEVGSGTRSKEREVGTRKEEELKARPAPESAPTPDEQYLLRRLFEIDSNWSEVTLPALVQLNQAWGTDVVRSALGRLREAPPDHVAKPYGLLAAVCAEIAKESA